jgi:hypothetical protein
MGARLVSQTFFKIGYYSKIPVNFFFNVYSIQSTSSHSLNRSTAYPFPLSGQEPIPFLILRSLPLSGQEPYRIAKVEEGGIEKRNGNAGFSRFFKKRFLSPFLLSKIFAIFDQKFSYSALLFYKKKTEKIKTYLDKIYTTKFIRFPQKNYVLNHEGDLEQSQQPFFISCKKLRIETNTCFYGCFYLGPFDPGQSLTIANALRRTLLSELKGIAITSVEIEGAFHEYSILKGIQDSVLDILLNLKEVVLKKKTVFKFIKQQIGYLRARGPGIVRAADLKLPPFIQCINPDQYIATLSEDGIFTMKFFINEGKNYHLHVSSKNLNSTNQIANRLLIDAVFMPVLKVNYIIESNEQANDFISAPLIRFNKNNSMLFTPDVDIFEKNSLAEKSKTIKTVKVGVVAPTMASRKQGGSSPDKSLAVPHGKAHNRTLVRVLTSTGATAPVVPYQERALAPIGVGTLRRASSQSLLNRKKKTITNLNNGGVPQQGIGGITQGSSSFLVGNERGKKVKLLQTQISIKPVKKTSILFGKAKTLNNSRKPILKYASNTLIRSLSLYNSKLKKLDYIGQNLLKKNKLKNTSSLSHPFIEKTLSIIETPDQSLMNFKINSVNTAQSKIDLKQNIVLELWTNGSLHPRAALYQGIKNLLSIFSKLKQIKFLGSIYKSEKNYKNFLKLFIKKWKNQIKTII